MTNARIEAIYPLTPMQAGMLFHTLYSPDSGVYIEQYSWTLHGEVDLTILEECWQRVVDRHAVLRTAFTWEGLDQPLQVVGKVKLRSAIQDWRAVPVAEQQSQILDFLQAEREKPFQMNKAPLLRLVFIMLANNAYRFVWSYHHILLDGWSAALILKEVFDLYQALSQGRNPALEPVRPYQDYVAWLRKQDLGKAETYWRRTLRGFKSPTPLGLGHAETDSHRSARADEQHIHLSAEATTELQRYARHQQVTLNTLVQGAWALLLSRYSGEEDVVFGVTVSGRPTELSGVERMVGLFINTLPLRIQIDEQRAVGEWLRQIQNDQAEMRQYEYSPLAQVQGWSEVDRGATLFESIVVFENYPISQSLEQFEKLSSETPAHELQPFEQNHYPLILAARPGRELALGIIYEHDRFSPQTVRRLLGHLEQLLIGMENNTRVGELRLLTTTEEGHQLDEYNKTETAYLQLTVPELFEHQVELAPDAIALSSGAEKLTYADLNRRANKLARHLRTLGVGPEVSVALALERTAEMVVSVLAVLKAGGVYVPVDPEYPIERISYVLRDAKVAVVLTQAGVAERLPQHNAKLVCVDNLQGAIARQSDKNLDTKLMPENLAYIIHTSGSTGQPKGVMIPHRALSNFLQAMLAEFQLTTDDILASVTTLSFDIAALEIFLPLLAGAALVVVSRELASSGAALARVLKESGATVMQATPTTWRLLLEADWVGDQNLKVLCGGEALPRALATRIWERTKSFWNLYGPTETTIWSASHKFEQIGDIVPLGGPIANTQIYILDSSLRLMPTGLIGEIYIGGEGLARGYCNRPHLTAEKFICDPFRGASGARLYRTGDLGCYLEEGTLLYAGRVDEQLKIRGYRIEPGEIESLLEKHDAVRQAVVVARSGPSDHQQLVAYVLPDYQCLNSAQRLTQAELEDEVLSKWEISWNETYNRESRQVDPTFNINGWTSSYTSQPVPAEEMKEWLDHTVERILSCRPRRVLEIGCGTGMLLFRIAPHCEEYYATDMSRAALVYIQRQLNNMLLPGVTLLQREAHEYESFAGRRFDTLILNSVVQYFPDVDYLVRVLEGAVSVMESGGCIFIGDVRNLNLLEAFHTSVELSRASAEQPLKDLARVVQARVRQEEELCIAPDFFHALKQHLPRIKDVQIQLKRGRSQNELTRFRYDVVLQADAEPKSTSEARSMEWKNGDASLSCLRQLLIEKEPDVLIVKRIPNGRLLQAIKAAESLGNQNGLLTVRDLVSSLPNIPSAQAMDPEDFWTLGADLSYATEVSWLTPSAEGTYDVVFRRRRSECMNAITTELPNEPTTGHSWARFANNPLEWLTVRKLAPQLRSYLQERLPEYMLPATFVLLNDLPLTPNGKIDRKALPAAGDARSELIQPYVAPRDKLEQQIAEIWQDTLNIRPVGIKDDFFELGGHSLLALILLGRIQKQFDQQLPLALFFPGITVEKLADILRDKQRSATLQSPILKIQPQGRRPPFFCVHSALGFAFHYAVLARHLGLDQPFYGLQAPGLEQDVEPIGDPVEMAAHYVKAIRAIEPNGPYYIGGSSLGALVAFEMAQQLRSQSEEVALLALFDIEVNRKDRPTAAQLDNVDDAELLTFVLSEYLALSADHLRQMNPDEQLLHVLGKAKPINLFPPGFGLPQLRRLLKVYKATARAWALYVAQPYSGRVTLFRADDHELAPGPDPFMGWNVLAPGRVNLLKVPGDHVSMLREPHVRVLARRLTECLDSARANK